MPRYSRSSLLKLRYWWKIPESCFGFKTSRYVQQQQQYQVKPLCSKTWNTLKSMGLLRRFRGTRKRRNTSRIFPIQSRIATNLEFEYFETRTTEPQRPNSNNLINIQFDTLEDNSGGTQSEPGMRENNSSLNSKHCDFALFNPRSICNKALLIKDSTVDNDFDFLALTETWLKPGDVDNIVVNDLCPKGYNRPFHGFWRHIDWGGKQNPWLLRNTPCISFQNKT